MSDDDAVTTADAVVVIPGIMGSVLTDAATGGVLWGFQSPRVWLDAWLTGHALDLLAMTDDELGGRTGRVVPAGLLRFPAWAPGLRGFEPYTDMLRHLVPAVRDPEAVLPFPYDWRLSIEHNGGLLAAAATGHLDRWRRHPRGSSDARLVLVAHSMGGLVARWFTEVLGGAPEVRTTVTLGTPYHGSVASAMLLARGDNPVKLPRKHLRRIARAMPGVYDLLPSYRCVEDHDDVRRLDAADVAGFGGVRELTEQATARHDRLMSGPAGPLRQVVGVNQPTPQAMTVGGGTARGLDREARVEDGRLVRRDWHGDGTVYRLAATAFGEDAAVVSQAHGSLARTREVLDQVRDVLVVGDRGAPLGDDGLVPLGMHVDDMAVVGDQVVIGLSGVEPGSVGVVVDEVATGRREASLRPTLHSDRVEASFTPHVPGLYRVSAKAGSASAVVQHVMVLPHGIPEEMADD